MSNQNQIIAIVGMCGSGKSTISEALIERGFHYVRFGQITLDEIAKRKLPKTAENEQMIREELRKNHGMAAFALLNIERIKDFHKKGNVVIDGLYSWAEYKYLKENLGRTLIVVAIYTPPQLRYQRLTDRSDNHGQDTESKYRSFSIEDAKKRDFAEIENLEKGGPIAMADFTLINTKNKKYLLDQFEEILKEIQKNQE